MQMTTLLNRIDGRADELALIRSEPISMQWTNELRRNIGLHPSCKLLRELLNLDLYTRTVGYPLLIKGWSASRIGRISDLLKILLAYFTFSWKKELHVVAGDLSGTNDIAGSTRMVAWVDRGA